MKTDEAGQFQGYLRRPMVRDWKETIDLKAVARVADKSLGGVIRGTSDTTHFRVNPLKVVLAKTASLKVRVLNPEGRRITDAKMTASDVHPGWHTDLGGPVTHPGEGTYLMTGLIPGLNYYLAAEVPGYKIGSTEKQVLKPDETRDVGVIRLDWRGKKAVPGLIKMLQSANKNVHGAAALELAELGADAADAVPVLSEKLRNDPNNSIRYNVAEALGKIGPAAKSAVPDLIRALKEDPTNTVQREAATALGLIGDLSALPALKEALKNPESDVQRAAAESIKLLEKTSGTP